MTTTVAIDGVARIRRNAPRGIAETGRNDIEAVAINDLGPVATNAHLLRYDSVHGRYPADVTTGDDRIDVRRGPIKVTATRTSSAGAASTWRSDAPASSPRATRPPSTWRTDQGGRHPRRHLRLDRGRGAPGMAGGQGPSRMLEAAAKAA